MTNTTQRYTNWKLMTTNSMNIAKRQSLLPSGAEESTEKRDHTEHQNEGRKLHMWNINIPDNKHLLRFLQPTIWHTTVSNNEQHKDSNRGNNNSNLTTNIFFPIRRLTITSNTHAGLHFIISFGWNIAAKCPLRKLKNQIKHTASA